MSTGMGPSGEGATLERTLFRSERSTVRERLADLARDFEAESRACEMTRPDASEAYSDAAAMLRGVIREIAEGGA